MVLNPKSAIDDHWHSKITIKSVVPGKICCHIDVAIEVLLKLLIIKLKNEILS